MIQELPKDPQTVAAILEGLTEKDADETRCRYPTCHDPRQITPGSGRPSAYCQKPEHTAVTNHRARQQLKAIAAGGTPETAPKRETLAGVAQMESLRQSVVSGMLQLQGNLERYVTMLTEIADPDISVAQIQAAQAQVETRIAEVQQSLSMERSLRLAAEAARQTALQNAQSEHEAAELAIQQMEEAETKRLRQREETEQQLAQIQTEKDSAIAQVQAEAQRQIEEIQRQAREAIGQARTATAEAQEQAKEADIRANTAETEARERVAAASQQVLDANANLERERTERERETGRLRDELIDAHKQAEIERAEARTRLERECTERERETGRLRDELTQEHKRTEQAIRRADKLAELTDDLREKLAKLQIKEQENPNQ